MVMLKVVKKYRKWLLTLSAALLCYIFNLFPIGIYENHIFLWPGLLFPLILSLKKSWKQGSLAAFGALLLQYFTTSLSLHGYQPLFILVILFLWILWHGLLEEKHKKHKKIILNKYINELFFILLFAGLMLTLYKNFYQQLPPEWVIAENTKKNITYPEILQIILILMLSNYVFLVTGDVLLTVYKNLRLPTGKKNKSLAYISISGFILAILFWIFDSSAAKYIHTSLNISFEELLFKAVPFYNIFMRLGFIFTCFGGILIISYFINKQSEAEKILKLNEHKYKEIFQNIPSDVTVYRPIADGKEFVVIDYNKAGKNENPPLKEIRHKKIELVFPNANEYGLPEILRKVYLTNLPHHHPISLYNGKNLVGWTKNYIYRLSSGEIVTVHEDITPQKKAELSLKESEKKYRELIENLNEGILVFDDKGTITLANPALCHILGYNTEELIGKNLFQFIPEDYFETYEQQLKSENTRPKESQKLIFYNKNKEKVITSVSASPIFNNMGNYKGSITAVTNITETIRNQKEKEKLFKQLELKNQELEKFTYTVSHDLKSPLISVKGFLGFLKEDIANGENENIDDDIYRINKAVEKMHALLDDLLKLSRIGRIVNQSAKIDCNLLIQETLEILEIQLKEINAKVDLQPDLPVLSGDSQRIAEIFQNLITNAIKFRSPSRDLELKIQAEQKENMAFFSIQDNGIGLDKKYHNKIFNLFEKLNNAAEGTGIGLTVVQKIINAYNGKIWIESEGLDRGTKFIFTLPTYQKQNKD